MCVNVSMCEHELGVGGTVPGTEAALPGACVGGRSCQPPKPLLEAAGGAGHIVGSCQGLSARELLSQVVDRSFFQALKQK